MKLPIGARRQITQHYLAAKDLARIMGVSVRTVQRWSKRLKVPPSVPGYSAQRWNVRAAHLLLTRWEKFNHANPHA